jgi:hypothetical protein
MSYDYDRRKVAAAPSTRSLIHALVDRESYRMISKAMKKWGEGKLSEWDKEEFYRQGGAKAVLAYIIEHHDAKDLRAWIEKAIDLPWTHLPHTPTLTYKGGTLELTFTLSPNERSRDDEVEGDKKRIEDALGRLGADWDLNDWHETAEGWWDLAYECVVKWNVPVETLIRKYIGGLVNSTGRSPKWVTWGGK